MWAARQLSSHSWYPSGRLWARRCLHPAVCSERTRPPPGCGPDHLKQTVSQSVSQSGNSLTHRDPPDQKHQVARYQRFVPELRREAWGTPPWGEAGEGSHQRWVGPPSPCPGCSRSLLVFRSDSPHLKLKKKHFNKLSCRGIKKNTYKNIINVSLYCKQSS